MIANDFAVPAGVKLKDHRAQPNTQLRIEDLVIRRQSRDARALALLVCLVALLPHLAWGAEAGFTLEQVLGYAFPESLIASAHGSKIAWTFNIRGRCNIWVAAGPEFKARALTTYSEDDGQEITSLSVSNDGEQVIYVRGGDHSARDPRPTNPLSLPQGGKVEIWNVPFAGGTPRRLAEGDWPVLSPAGDRVAFLKNGAAWIVPTVGSSAPQQAISLRGDIWSLAWSPDGRRLAFVSLRENHAFVGIYSDEHTPILWLGPSTSIDLRPRWSPNGKQIAFVRLPGSRGAPGKALELKPKPWAIWVADTTTGSARERWTSGSMLRDSDLGYFDRYVEWAAGGRIVFKSYQDGWQHLYSLAPSERKPLLLTPGDYMVEDVAISPDRNYVVFSGNTGSDSDDVDRRHLYKVAVDRAGTQTLTSGTGLEWSPAVTADERLIFLSSTPQYPPRPAMLPASGHAISVVALKELNADFPTVALVTPRRISFKSMDGVTVHGQLFEPRGFTGRRPALLYLHGGPVRQMLLGWHYMGAYSSDYAANQYLASRGYVVLSVNYRGGIGYGHDFNFPAAAGPRGASEYQDIEAAGRYLQTLPQVDGKLIGLYGGSYGGYLTALGLARNSDLFKAGVDIAGVHNFTTDEWSNVKDLLQQRYEKPPDTQLALDVAWQSSPVSAVANWRSPVLFIHGDDDRNVPFDQTIDLLRRLDATSVSHEVLTLPDETHDIVRYANALAMYRGIDEFFEHHLPVQSH